MSKPQRRGATQGDVARLAGVSTAVVSYVVNNGPRPVSDESRKRVLDAIATLGYHPNASARALRSGSSGLIGVAVPETSNPFQAEFVDRIGALAQERDYGTVLICTANDPSRERDLISELINRGVDGLIISPLTDPHNYELIATTIPRVILSAEAELPGYLCLAVDAAEAMRTATEHLIEHGHSTIPLLIGPESQSGDERTRGWRDALYHAGLGDHSPIRVPWTRLGGYEATKALISIPDRPSAILAGSDLIGLGALLAIHESGLNVPEDIALITFDGTADTRYSWPPLTTLRQPLDDIAGAAVDAIVSGTFTPGRVAFPMPLIIRRSCGCDYDFEFSDALP